MPYPNFVIVNETMNWSDAQSYCRDHHTDLATVRSSTDNSKILKLLPNNEQFWIGLSRELNMYWSDGSGYSFSHWASVDNRLGTHNVTCGVADLQKSG